MGSDPPRRPPDRAEISVDGFGTVQSALDAMGDGTSHREWLRTWLSRAWWIALLPTKRMRIMERTMKDNSARSCR